MQAVILAAGRGERMRAIASSKPLVPVLGLPLIERSVRCLQTCGIADIIIVTGHAQNALQGWAASFAVDNPAVSVRLVHNANWEQADNGSSLLAAMPYVSGPFLLLMADHVYAPELITSLCQATPPPGGAVLAVDGAIHRPDIDLNDVTRVALDGHTIRHIDKDIAPYHGFDTGAFLCTHDVGAIMQAQADQGRTRLSDAMQALAVQGRLEAHRIDGLYWQDVDTPDMLTRAEAGLLDQACGKPADGMVARRLNRPLSRRITRRLVHTGITPNQVSLAAFGLGLLAAFFLALPSYLGLLAGGILTQLASVVDGCDGEIARLRLQTSDYGGWLDALLDRYADAAVLAALTWHIMQTQAAPQWMWLGIAAIAGSFVSSYSAHKADHALPRSSLRLGRDTRSFLVMVGAVLAVPKLTLGLIAVLMNATVLHRIVAMRRHAAPAS